MNEKPLHTLVIWAEHKLGVLNKILSLCRRRRYNIETVNAGGSHKKDLHHITLLLREDADRVGQIVNQINKIVEVLSVEVVEENEKFDRELALIITASPEVSDHLLSVAAEHDSLSLTQDADDPCSLTLVGKESAVNVFLEEVNINDNIVKLARSGTLALKK